MLAAIARDAALPPAGPVPASELAAHIADRLVHDPRWQLVVAEDAQGRLGGYAVWQAVGQAVHGVLVGHWSADPTALRRLIASGRAWAQVRGARRVTGHARHRPRAWGRVAGWQHTADLWVLEA